ncbi:MAG: TonB-dependent receptor [Gammaproteobacteria bacterium]
MNPSRHALRRLLLAAAGATVQPALVLAEEQASRALQEIVIVAPYGTGVDPDLVPANVQRATAEQIGRAQALDLSDFLNRNFASVNVNHAQNNPLQPDVNFRGFTASPLLGLSPGLTVYQNGVRINEPFGDTVNWDLVPLSAIDSVQLLAGTNPVFGLNTLGGALSLQMKNGFSFQGTAGEAYAGSFGRRVASAQHGGNDGRWGYYGAVDYFEEDGWRDFSPSDALRFFGALSLRGDRSTLDLSVAHADTNLRGNGSSPAELLAVDREQVFTHPDITENSLTQVILEGSLRPSDAFQIAGNLFHRSIDTDMFNGDGTIFEECEFGTEEFLVEEDFIDLNADGACSAADDAEIELVLDPNGAPIEAELDGEELNAINNLGRREQEGYGGSAQLSFRSSVRGRENNLTLGAAYAKGETSFDSAVEVARLLEDRSTSRSGIFADEFRTNLDSASSAASVYFLNALHLSERAVLTLSGRYDDTRIRLADRSGQTPELDGSHGFERFNPAAGITFRATRAITMFGSYGQSARAPTPVELACASEDAPCNLPNAFLADPPLDEVVARSGELGVRGNAGALRWRLGAFQTTNEDDILFQTVGGAQANVGFFDNVADTRRAGIELGFSQRVRRVHWFVEYSYLEATFEDAFVVNSPNHPLFEDEVAPQIAGDGKLLVAEGSSIPGIPRHQANLGIDLSLNGRFMIGADALLRSGVHVRGDEVNALGRTDSYAVLNLRSEFRLGDRGLLFARIENVLDEEYETFGLLGEPDEVFETFSDPRFFGAGPPRGAWIGIRFNL